jgi:hypothetical protein
VETRVVHVPVCGPGEEEQAGDDYVVGVGEVGAGSGIRFVKCAGEAVL